MNSKRNDSSLKRHKPKGETGRVIPDTTHHSEVKAPQFTHLEEESTRK